MADGTSRILAWVSNTKELRRPTHDNILATTVSPVSLNMDYISHQLHPLSPIFHFHIYLVHCTLGLTTSFRDLVCPFFPEIHFPHNIFDPKECHISVEHICCFGSCLHSAHIAVWLNLNHYVFLNLEDICIKYRPISIIQIAGCSCDVWCHLVINHVCNHASIQLKIKIVFLPSWQLHGK